jgi:transcriptional regulator with XRE-family HTH domain
MRRALWMRAQGLTRTEIAAALQISEGYVGELFARARQEALASVKEATAEQLVADLSTAHALHMSKLAVLYDKAEKMGDLKAMVAIMRERRQHNDSLRDLYKDLGAFDRFQRFNQPKDERDQSMALLDEMFREFAGAYQAIKQGNIPETSAPSELP